MMAMTNQQNIRGVLLLNEPMHKHTSWRAGGSADQFYTPADAEDLALFISALPEDEPLMFLGLGSNLLVRDEGIRGTVISLKGSLAEIEVIDANNSCATLRVGAGVSCAKLARYCHRNDLPGAEFFAGIPGLLGGALAMNAGAFGGETWPLVKQVVTVDMQGGFNQRTADDYEISYRCVTGKSNEWFISADLSFEKGCGKAAATRVKGLLETRNKTQPVGLASCGSVFKNPQNDYAARLIEASGLKGFAIGGAVVSEKHANFIINTGNAGACDIEKLIKYVQKIVKEKQGVDLQTEVRIVGG
ncbi:MAG TPA: UDP-N-acetylmuramate dehydrogenase [Gammaproteobacteria bacterium]|nr:UDP-N-acetylmuramate dehydrogenase [Gammaproteobacteria bacterium]